MRKLEHNMLLDAKQVEDLGLLDYLMRAFDANSEEEVEFIFDDLIYDLASCDESRNYEEKKHETLS